MSKPDRYFVEFESKAKIAKLTVAIEDADINQIFDTVEASDDIATARKILQRVMTTNGGWGEIKERTNLTDDGFEDDGIGWVECWTYDVETVED